MSAESEIFSSRLDRMIMHWGSATPDRIAIRSHSDSFSYQQLSDGALAIRCQLLELKKNSSYVGIMSDNPFFVMCALLAAMLSGKRFIVLSPRWDHTVFSKVISQVDIGAFITDSATAIPALSHSAKFKVLQTDLSMITTRGPTRESKMYHSTEICSLLTAGSEGTPSVVKKTHHAIFSEIIAWLIELRITSRTNTAVAQPLHYTGSILFTLVTLLCGGTVSFCRSRPESSLFDDIRELRPTHILLVPSQYRRLRDKVGVSGVTTLLSQVDVFLSLGDRLSIVMREELAKMLSDRFVEMWGNTEGLGTLRKAEEGADIRSVGRPFIGDEIFIREVVGQDVDGNDIGHICGRSDAGEPWKEKKGVVRSDDLGYLQNRYVYTTGRSSDIFIDEAGRIISSWDIEHLIHSLDSSLEVAVIQKDKHSLVIFISGANSEIEESIYKTLGNFLARFRIRKYEVRCVEELPLTEIGKVDRQIVKLR